MKTAFIGGGNMAIAIISGLLEADPDTVVQVADPGAGVKKRLEAFTCFTSAVEAIEGMDVIVLAVKPQILPAVLDEINGHVTARQLVISIMAGVTTRTIAAGLTVNAPVIRTMPNTPALVGLGITALYAHSNCTSQHRKQAQQLMSAAGETVWLEDESLMDVVTAVSGSGPAYFFYMIEAMRNAGTRLGLPADVASKLALHTAFGASTMALKSDVDVHELRQQVTSRGGTTQAALESMHRSGFEELIDAAVSAAAERGRQLAAGTSQTPRRGS